MKLPTAANLALALAVACARPPSRPASAAALTIAPASAEVWAWDLDVRGEGTAPLAQCRIRTRGSSSTEATVRGRSFAARVHLAPGDNDVFAECSDVASRALRSPVVRYRAMLARFEVRAPPRAGAPPPVDHPVVYGVVPPLYGRPPLAAVTRALPQLAELGVDVLWIAPVFATPPGDYGYAVTDYFAVRDDYGTSDDLGALVDAAHRLGLRVVLDLPINDTSAQHRYFEDALALGRRSHYWGFYVRDASGAAMHYFDWVGLPNLDYGNAEVDRWIAAATANALARWHVDGFRLDAAWGIRQRTPSYWDAWIADVRSAVPGAFLVAEAPARDPFYATHGFDAAYDWGDELGHWAWEGVFDDDANIPAKLDAALAATRARAPDETRVLRFLDNNDTGVRFVTRHGTELTRVAAAALLTLPGVPCLFTGDEVGAAYEPYKASAPLDHANDDDALRAWYRKLVALRRARPSLRSAGWARASLGERAPDDVYAYFRTDERTRETTLVVLHFSPRKEHVTIASAAPGRAAFRDLLGGRVLHADARGALDCDLGGYDVLALAPIHGG